MKYAFSVRGAIVGLGMLAIACAPAAERTIASPSAGQMAEFWVDPGEGRNLFDGPAIDGARAPSGDRFDIVERDTRGFSITYRVKDEHGREFNVKIGPEAQTEVVSSRIVWALGYHELPSYFVERWIGVANTRGQQFGGSRFRPRELGLKSLGEWSWRRNPYVGTRPYNGLLVLMMILNGTDLKDPNNELYRIADGTREHASRWYVVKDLGASLGETGRFDPRRGSIDAFEREPFVLRVEEGRVRFAYRGRHRGLFERITVDDVRWTCERLQRVTDRQLRDAFRAGHFDDAVTARYIAKIRKKVSEGLALR